MQAHTFVSEQHKAAASPLEHLVSAASHSQLEALGRQHNKHGSGSCTFSLLSVALRMGLVTRMWQASVPLIRSTCSSGFQYTRETRFQCRRLYSRGLHVQPSSHSNLTAPEDKGGLSQACLPDDPSSLS